MATHLVATTAAPAARRPGTSATRSPGNTWSTRLLKILRPYLPAILHLLLPVEALGCSAVAWNRPRLCACRPLLPLIRRLITLVDVALAVREDIATAGS